MAWRLADGYPGRRYLDRTTGNARLDIIILFSDLVKPFIDKDCVLQCRVAVSRARLAIYDHQILGSQTNAMRQFTLRPQRRSSLRVDLGSKPLAAGHCRRG